MIENISDPVTEDDPPFFPMADPDSIPADNGNVVDPEEEQMPDAGDDDG